MPYVPGTARGCLQYGMAHADEHRIVVLRQNEIESFTSRPAGFIVVEGAPFSHTMVHLMGMGVPTVILDERQVSMLAEGQELILDGMRGRISSELDTLTEMDQLT